MNRIINQVKTLVKNEYFILFVILALGFLLRLYKLDSPVADWHSWRQADTAAVSRNFASDGINFLFPKYDDISSIQSGIFNPQGYRMVEFPVFNAIHAFLFKTFDNLTLEAWGRLLTGMVSVITALFIYLLGKKHYNSKIGLLASFFFLTIPFNVYFSRVILPDPLGVLFAVSGLYFFGINNVVSAILFALALLQKPYFGFYFVPLIPTFLKKEKLKETLIFLVISFLPFVLWRYWTSLFPEGIPFYKWAFNGDRIRFHPAFWRWLFGERVGILILGSWGLVPFAFGIIKKLQNKFNLLFLLGMALYLIVVATANVRHDYYQIIIIPAIVLTLATGTLTLWKKSKFLLFLSLLIMYLIGWDRVKPFYQINHPELIEVGKVVDQTLPKDALIVAPYNGDTAFLYQMNRKGWPAVDNSIENIIAEGADYYVSLDLNSADTLKFSKMFKTIEKKENFVILDLHQGLENK